MDRLTVGANMRRQAELLRRIQKNAKRKPYPSDLLLEHMGLSVGQVLQNKAHYNQTLGRIFEGLVMSAFIDLPGFQPGLKNGHLQPADVVLGKEAIEIKYSIADTTPDGEKYRIRKHQLSSQGLTPVALVFRHCPSAVRVFRGWQLHMADDCIAFIEQRGGQSFQQLLNAHNDFLDG
jgi:hypothetical protein